MIDLQKCSPTPEPHNSQTLDLLVIHNSTEGRAYCMMWDESISGGNEVASCLLKWSQVCNISEEIEELSIWSDYCPSQNRKCANTNVILCSVGEESRIQKFLTKEHTHLEADSDHSIIERERKNIPQLKIITPWDWQQLVREKRSSWEAILQTNFGNDFQTVLLSRNIQKEIGRFPELPRIRESLRKYSNKKSWNTYRTSYRIYPVFSTTFIKICPMDKENDDENQVQRKPQLLQGPPTGSPRSTGIRANTRPTAKRNATTSPEQREQQNLNLQEQKENKEGHAAVESRLKKTNKNVPADYVGVCLQLDEILRHINEWEFNKKVTTVIPKLYQGRVKISEYKFNHLQILKKTLDQDYHSFYDELPH
nr:unnamed protein product [Callosobruchus chinensis]